MKGAFLGNAGTRGQLPGLPALDVHGRINLDDLVTYRLPVEWISKGLDLMVRRESQ